jgi:hypothetical protein
VPLNLAVNPVGIAVPPTPGVTAQPTPPVNPAPPGGARKEARQKQAATAKSEEGSAQDVGVDLAQQKSTDPAANATARDRPRAQPGSVTATRRNAQPSAWTTGLQWGGGMTLMALALALGFTTVRPTPRRRPGPDVAPAPAWLRNRR